MATYKHEVIIKFEPRKDDEAHKILARIEELAKQHNLPITEAGMYVEETGLAAPLIEEQDVDLMARQLRRRDET
jgi:hypothetical protein